MSRELLEEASLSEQIEMELDQIKRLLILLLMKIGTETTEIATALGRGKATVSRMVPKQKIKSLSLNK